MRYKRIPKTVWGVVGIIWQNISRGWFSDIRGQSVLAGFKGESFWAGFLFTLIMMNFWVFCYRWMVKCSITRIVLIYPNGKSRARLFGLFGPRIEKPEGRVQLKKKLSEIHATNTYCFISALNATSFEPGSLLFQIGSASFLRFRFGSTSCSRSLYWVRRFKWNIRGVYFKSVLLILVAKNVRLHRRCKSNLWFKGPNP